jgi:hypothetical protein
MNAAFNLAAFSPRTMRTRSARGMGRPEIAAVTEPYVGVDGILVNGSSSASALLRRGKMI